MQHCSPSLTGATFILCYYVLVATRIISKSHEIAGQVITVTPVHKKSSTQSSSANQSEDQTDHTLPKTEAGMGKSENKPASTPQVAVEVRGIEPNTKPGKLKMYFEGPRVQGGPVKDVKIRADGVATVIFESAEG